MIDIANTVGTSRNEDVSEPRREQSPIHHLVGGKGSFGSQNKKLAVIDHSAQLHQDFEQFLFKDTLSDLKIVVRKGLGTFHGVPIGD